MEAIRSYLPLQLFESGQLLYLASACQGGLILHYPHHAEFAGAGAAVGGCFDLKCKSVYTVGEVQLAAPMTYQERQQAFVKRIRYTRQLQKITYIKVPLQRAYLIVQQLNLWLPKQEVMTIPEPSLAQLVGVLPKTVVLARRRYLLEHANEMFSEEEPTLLQGLHTRSRAEQRETVVIPAIHR
jgi:hypothetical protein